MSEQKNELLLHEVLEHGREYTMKELALIEGILAKVKQKLCANCDTPLLNEGKLQEARMSGWDAAEEFTGARVEEAKREERTDIWEGLCVFIGNLMLEDMDAGKLLGQQLKPIFNRCKPGNWQALQGEV